MTSVRSGNHQIKEMSINQKITKTFKNADQYGIRFDVTGKDATVLGQVDGDWVYVEIPLILNSGDDWETMNLKFEKIAIDDVRVDLFPQYDLTTASGAMPGKVSGNYPVYFNVFQGNTVAENENQKVASIMCSGKYTSGLNTTKMNVKMENNIFQTTFSGTEYKTEAILDKTTRTGIIDGFIFENPHNILQLGRILVAIRKSDFLVKQNDSQGQAAIKKHFLEKNGIDAEDKKEDVVSRRKGKKCPGPQQPQQVEIVDSGIYDSNYADELDKDGHLYVGYNFHIMTTIVATFNVKGLASQA